MPHKLERSEFMNADEDKQEIEGEETLASEFDEEVLQIQDYSKKDKSKKE